MKGPRDFAPNFCEAAAYVHAHPEGVCNCDAVTSTLTVGSTGRIDAGWYDRRSPLIQLSGAAVARRKPEAGPIAAGALHSRPGTFSEGR